MTLGQVGAPLSVHIIWADTHDKGLADAAIISIVVPQPDSDDGEQNLCLGRGYAYPDVHAFTEQVRSIAHIN